MFVPAAVLVHCERVRRARDRPQTMASHGAEASNEGATPAPANSGAPAPANPPPQDWDSDSFRGPFEGGLRRASFVLQPYDPLEFRLARTKS